MDWVRIGGRRKGEESFLLVLRGGILMNAGRRLGVRNGYMRGRDVCFFVCSNGVLEIGRDIPPAN